MKNSEAGYLALLRKIMLAWSILLFGIAGIACQDKKIDDIPPQSDVEGDITSDRTVNPAGETIARRINLPAGFQRIDVASGSFAEYLRNLPLKPDGATVKYFDGREKFNTKAYVAVIDLDIGNRDLQQCADAIMRLRGEYFYQRGELAKISFQLTNGFTMSFQRWADGGRLVVDGNHTAWQQSAAPSASYETFRKYMDMVFAYAGTLSLEQELVPVAFVKMQIGDVLIKGGSPGHAVLVVDMAENKQTGEKIYLLAQSYMPAQDIHLLANPSNVKLSPWYVLDASGGEIVTPEWNFTPGQLRCFVQ